MPDVDAQPGDLNVDAQQAGLSVTAQSADLLARAQALVLAIAAQQVDNPDPRIVLADSITLSDLLAISASLAQADGISIMEALTQLGNLALTDAIGLGDFMVAKGLMSLVDAATLTDLMTVAGRVALADGSAISDLLLVTSQMALADSSTMLDAITQIGKMALADGMTITDTVSSFLLSVSTDAIPMSDAMVEKGYMVLADAMTLSDTMVALSKMSLADAVTLSEALTQLAKMPIADATTLSDVLTQLGKESLADALTMTDAVTIKRNIILYRETRPGAFLLGAARLGTARPVLVLGAPSVGLSKLEAATTLSSSATMAGSTLIVFGWGERKAAGDNTAYTLTDTVGGVATGNVWEQISNIGSTLSSHAAGVQLTVWRNKGGTRAPSGGHVFTISGTPWSTLGSMGVVEFYASAAGSVDVDVSVGASSFVPGPSPYQQSYTNSSVNSRLVAFVAMTGSDTANYVPNIAAWTSMINLRAATPWTGAMFSRQVTGVAVGSFGIAAMFVTPDYSDNTPIIILRAKSI